VRSVRIAGFYLLRPHTFHIRFGGRVPVPPTISMTAAQRDLGQMDFEIAQVKQYIRQSEERGRLDCLYGMTGFTHREWYGRKLDQLEGYRDDLTRQIRFNEVVTRWTWRNIHRAQKRVTAEAPSCKAVPDWIRPMRVDDAIIGRKVADCG
jgi:hypothetical protein